MIFVKRGERVQEGVVDAFSRFAGIYPSLKGGVFCALLHHGAGSPNTVLEKTKWCLCSGWAAGVLSVRLDFRLFGASAGTCRGLVFLYPQMSERPWGIPYLTFPYYAPGVKYCGIFVWVSS